ncbi:hypothetical protein JCM30471_25460 [Desulfuromonas carbonis]|uniref:DUF2325 domain-containing protein n=1 Tax=Desulfuromonas sp. DDH964 TaxID=1823759 RepID=UPI00078CBEFE|nr:DUF2325 domain-containing protein [Desulfuromonas sp. DDH964]AMV70552.1 hypothetical protein DBW_0152 [Desulfuromonas sp. DDH964]
MQISLIGGLDRLQRHYREEAQKLGIELRVYNTAETNLAAKVSHCQAVLLLTGKISHRARREVMKVARAQRIPVSMSHQCGVCAVRDCLNCLQQQGATRS